MSYLTRFSSRVIAAACLAAIAMLFAQGLSAQQPAAQPAPVPAAVAMQRPSPQDIEAAERALAGLVSSNAAVRTVVEAGLLELRRPNPGPNSAIVPNLAANFQAKHKTNLAVAAQGDAELLFMGDSITDFWRNTDGQFAGKPVQDKYFGKWKIANFGIAGDTTQGVLYRLRNGEGTGFKPKAVMLMIGTNNTGRNTAPEIAEGIGAVVLELQKDFPDAKILLLGVFPRGRAGDPVRATIARINTIISKLHDGTRVHYLDIGAKFLDPAGNIPTDVMSDALHPSTKGYEIWAEAVNAPLTALMSASR
jgi:lysophospholipase L1-like esterase